MPMRNNNPMEHTQVGVVRKSGRFRPNGSSAIDATLKKGAGYTPSYVTTGSYLLTFDEVGAELIACGADIMKATDADQKISIGAYSAANKTLAVKVWDISGTAAADLASDADTWISWWAEWQNTSHVAG